MTIDLENILACPKCKGKIRISLENVRQIKKGSVYCPHCLANYLIDNELLDFMGEVDIYNNNEWRLGSFVEGYKEFDKLCDHYDWAKYDGIPKIVESYRFPRMRGRLLEWLKPKDGDIILDVGCGAGFLIFGIKRLYPDKDICILGLDVVRNNIRILIDRKNREENNCIFGIAGYAEELPISASCIDIILCSETLEHIYDKQKAMKEMVKVLKPNGRLLISTPSKEVVRFWECIFYLPRMFRRVIEVRSLKEDPHAYDKPVSKRQLINLLSDSGMEIVRFEQNVFLFHESYCSKLPYIISVIWVKIAKLVDRYFKKINSFLGMHYVVEAKKHYEQN